MAKYYHHFSQFFANFLLLLSKLGIFNIFIKFVTEKIVMKVLDIPLTSLIILVLDKRRTFILCYHVILIEIFKCYFESLQHEIKL